MTITTPRGAHAAAIALGTFAAIVAAAPPLPPAGRIAAAAVAVTCLAAGAARFASDLADLKFARQATSLSTQLLSQLAEIGTVPDRIGRFAIDGTRLHDPDRLTIEIIDGPRTLRAVGDGLRTRAAHQARVTCHVSTPHRDDLFEFADGTVVRINDDGVSISDA